MLFSENPTACSYVAVVGAICRCNHSFKSLIAAILFVFKALGDLTCVVQIILVEGHVIHVIHGSPNM